MISGEEERVFLLSTLSLSLPLSLSLSHSLSKWWRWAEEGAEQTCISPSRLGQRNAWRTQVACKHKNLRTECIFTQQRFLPSDCFLTIFFSHSLSHFHVLLLPFGWRRETELKMNRNGKRKALSRGRQQWQQHSAARRGKLLLSAIHTHTHSQAEETMFIQIKSKSFAFTNRPFASSRTFPSPLCIMHACVRLISCFTHTQTDRGTRG